MYRSIVVPALSTPAYQHELWPRSPPCRDGVSKAVLAPPTKWSESVVGFAPFGAVNSLPLRVAHDPWAVGLPAADEFLASWRVGTLLAGANSTAWTRVLSSFASFFASSQNAGRFARIPASDALLVSSPPPVEIAFEVTITDDPCSRPAAGSLAFCRDGAIMLGNTDGDRHTFESFRTALLAFLRSRIVLTSAPAAHAAPPRCSPKLPPTSAEEVRAEGTCPDDAAATQTLETLLDMDTADTWQALYEWIVQGDTTAVAAGSRIPAWGAAAMLRLKQYLLAAAHVALLAAVHAHLHHHSAPYASLRA